MHISSKHYYIIIIVAIFSTALVILILIIEFKRLFCKNKHVKQSDIPMVKETQENLSNSIPESSLPKII